MKKVFTFIIMLSWCMVCTAQNAGIGISTPIARLHVAEQFSKNNFLPGRQIGLLAQNVEKIIPEAVNEKDGYKGVDYARLVPLLIEAIKEQEKRIQELEKQLKNKK
jgi:hypothetical protein